jgi:hypothetical protein
MGLPQQARPMLERGGFCVVNPASWIGCIVIKAWLAQSSKFENRLREIAMGYFSGRPPGMVMGLVASDATLG